MADSKPRITHLLTGKKYKQAAKFKIKNKDYFNWKYLYALLHEWFVDEGYATRDDEDFPETFYLHRETAKAGNEERIFWRFNKSILKNQFMKFEIDLDIHTLGVKPAELMYQGKKYKADWGEAEIQVTSRVVYDPEGAWNKNEMWKSIKNLFIARIINKNLEKYKKILYSDSYRLQEAIKTYFKLVTYMPEVEESQKFYDQKQVE